jgi:hypothetical protein
MDTAQAQYQTLVTEARKHAEQEIEAAKQKYGLGTYSRYELDLAKATIRFLDDKGADRIRASIQVAGTWSPDVWLWSWDNDSVPKAAKKQLVKVQEFGEQHEFEHLMGSFDRCEEAEAWTLTAIAAQILNAECLYRAPAKSSLVFLLLFDIQKVT